MFYVLWGLKLNYLHFRFLLQLKTSQIIKLVKNKIDEEWQDAGGR